MINKTMNAFTDFLHKETSGGIILLFFTASALVWANSPLGYTYDKFWHAPVGLSMGQQGFSMSLLHWINDGLMAVFFFVVGLEIKREVVAGELSSPKQAMLPIAAALGGMIVPALIFTYFNKGTAGQPGWGIPMATDIAFAIGILALLGKRVPLSVKVFLTALAIVDDLGAVLVIALFYTSEISMAALGTVLLIFIILIIIGRRGVSSILPYAVLGLLLWIAMLKSGVHATIAGVLTALTVPASISLKRDKSNPGNSETPGENQVSPLHRLEHMLHPWVSYGIMPVFALANAGVNITGVTAAVFFEPVSIGIMLGLVLGKQIGVTLFSFIAVKLNLASLPGDIGWRHIYGAGWLAGIGFTMSLFISALAFGEGEMLMISKIGILAASFISAAAGLCLLYLWTVNLPEGE
jgi:NhaA family Na+:H+ antiporter